MATAQTDTQDGQGNMPLKKKYVKGYERIKIALKV